MCVKIVDQIDHDYSASHIFITVYFRYDLKNVTDAQHHYVNM